MLTEVKLYGDLATTYGEEWNLDIHTPVEAFKAIDANHPGFLDRIQDGSKYAFVLSPKGPLSEEVGEALETLDLDRLQLPISNKQTLHIFPIPEGDIETYVIPWVATYIGTFWASVVVYAAVVVILIGVSRMLMPAPPGMDDTQEGDESYYFGGPVNTSRQGACVPVLYGGPLLVGSQVIGQSLIAEDVDDGDSETLKSTAYAEVVDAISEGPIEGFAGADLESSIYLDGTPFKAAGEQLFEGFKVGFTEGTQDQDAMDMNMSTNPSVSSVHNVGIVIRSTTGGLVRATQDPNVGRIKITVNTGRFLYVTPGGDTKSISVELKVHVQGTGNPSYTLVRSIWLTGVAQSSYYRTISFPVDTAWGSPPYNFKVERITPERTEEFVSLSSDVFWSSWTEEITSNCAYPLTAFAKTQFDAEKFSAIPTRGYLMKGLLINIPNNYNPITREYSGAWNGEFAATKQWTNNPAWVYYDLATNDRYGLGRYLTPDLIDKWALYAIAQYCDALVDDGYGGQEPRFACNLYLQTKGEAFSVLKELASSFRAIQFWAGGQLKVHQDAPGPVHSLFTPANVVGGEFNYSGSPKHKRFTTALVSWVNPADNYSTWIEYVEDPAGIQLYGINETSLTAVGCTSRGQAHRVGKYALLVSRLETDAVDFKTGMDAGSAVPGKISRIVDPLHNQSDEDVGGRLASVTDTTTVVLDRPVTLEVGHTYHITLTLPDGTQSSHQVNNGAGTVTPPTPISFSVALLQTPVDGAMWAISDDAESQRLYRVIALTEAKDSSPEVYGVSALRYDEETLTQADDPGPLESPDVPPLNPGLASPSALRLEDGVLPVGTTSRRYIDATWVAPSTGVVDHYTVTIINPAGAEQTLSTGATDYRLYDVVPGNYTFTIRAVNVAGQLSAGVSAAIIIDELLPIELISITGLELVGQGNDTNFVGPSAEFAWRMTSLFMGDMGDETFGGDTGIQDPWFRDYEIIMYDVDGEILRVDHVTDRSYTYTFDRNVEDGGPNRTFEIGVAARDIYNRTTEETLLEVTNPPPEGYTDVSIVYGIETIVASFIHPVDPDFKATRLHISELTGFTPDDTTIAYEGDDSTITVGNLPAEWYYIRLEGVDDFGPSGLYTNEYTIHIQSVNRIHDQIAGEIQESWLYQALNDRINLIDTPNSGLVDLVEANSIAIESILEGGFTGIATYYQGTDPQLGVPTPSDPAPALAEGDLWIDTSSGDAIQRWNGSAWDTLESGGNQTFYRDGPPDAPFDGLTPDPATLIKGDYWIDIHDYGPPTGPDNIPWMWTGSAWVNIRDGLLLSTVIQVDYLAAEISDPDTGTSAMAAYIRDLDLEVYGAGNGGNVAANATLIEQLGVEVTQKVTTYYQAGDPQSNVPAPVLVDGDLWFETDSNNHLWRWDAQQDLWSDARDSSATGVTTWIGTGIPNPLDSKYTTGDLYFDSDNLNKPYRFDGSVPEWVSIQDTTSTGITTYYQDEEPALPGQDPSTGDLWFDTDNANKIYRYNVNVWVAVTDGTSVGGTLYDQDTDPQLGVPTPSDPVPTLVAGDIWIETDNNDRPYEWDGAAWVDLIDNPVTIISAATAVERYARVAADGLAYAEYSMKVDVNGHIAGIGLSVSGTATGPIRSQIIMLADQFALGFPTREFEINHPYTPQEWVTPTQAFVDANGTPEVQPDGEVLYKWDYVYQCVNTGTSGSPEPVWPNPQPFAPGSFVWSGSALFICYEKSATLPFVTGNVITNLGHPQDEADQVELGIIISAAMIGHLSVENAHIVDGTINTAKIYDLNVDKITGGTLDLDPALGDAWIRLGGPQFELSTEKRRLTVLDDQTVGVERVAIGALVDAWAPEDFGIVIRDAGGNVMLSSGLPGVADEVDGTFIKDATIDTAKIRGSIQSSDYDGVLGFYLGVNPGSTVGYAHFNNLLITDGAGHTILSSGGDLGPGLDNNLVGVGSNLLPNSQMYPFNGGGWWNSPGGGAASSSFDNISSRVWDAEALDGQQWTVFPGCAQVHQNNNSQTGYFVYVSEDIPVDSSKEYQYGGRSGANRCNVTVQLNFLNSNKEYITTAPGSPVNANALNGGDALNGDGDTGTGWFLHEAFSGPLPAGTAYCRVVFLKWPTLSGSSDSWMFCTHAFLAEMKPDQTAFLPYNVGPETVSALYPITPENASTYISSVAIDRAHIALAAIDTAQIDDAAITTAKIGSLQVDTLRIGYNAVTVSQFDEQVIASDESGTHETIFTFEIETSNMRQVVINLGLRASLYAINPYGNVFLWRQADQKNIRIYRPDDAYTFSALCVDDAPRSGTNYYELWVSTNGMYISTAMMYTVGYMR